MLEIIKVNNSVEFKIIEKLANEILHEVYDPIIQEEHTDFFIKEFQSEKTIEKQIKHENFSYFFLSYNSKNVGYIGVQELKEKLILSKLYILQSFRGLKIGKAALQYVNKFAVSKNIKIIELIVNQQNQNAIEVYKKQGFEIKESIVNTFSNGKSVDDYKMEKSIR